MPIYEFVCMAVRVALRGARADGTSGRLPDCGSSNVRKQFSVFAAHGVESGPRVVRRRWLLRRLLRLRSLTIRRRR
jgi:hypothetical protein